jgi:SHS2 domain-containing protein
MFVCRRVKVLSLDREHWRITSVGVGETFELGRHPQGTEVKAITYSAMQIHENDDKAELFVIVDI